MIILAFWIVPVSATQPPQTLTMTFSGSTIVIGGTVGSQPIYLYGVAREPRGFINRIQSYEARLTDDAGAGQVTYPFDPARSSRSIWVAIDLVSGESVAGHPPGYPAAPMADPQERLKMNSSSQVAQLTAIGTLPDFLIVRPGVGIWHQSATSGSSLDDGTEDGKVTLSVSHFEPQDATTGPPPQTLQNGDVVFVIDSFHARYSLTKVGE
jgi:hypothetical protein